MQTVTNNYIMNSSITGSVIVQGVQGNNDSKIIVANVNESSGLIGEVVRIFAALDMRRKTAVLNYLYSLEDGKRLLIGR